MENVVSPRCNQVSRKSFFSHKAIKLPISIMYAQIVQCMYEYTLNHLINETMITKIMYISSCTHVKSFW